MPGINGVLPWNALLWQRLTGTGGQRTHAWLLHGPAGLGKLQFALSLAKYLLSLNERGQDLFAAGTHPDLHILVPQDLLGEDQLVDQYAARYLEQVGKGSKPKSVIAVDQVRRIIAALTTHGHTGNTRVVLIVQAQRMNINAANALLKVLEEPPSGVVFLLVSDQPERLPPTVRSRCTQATFRVPDRATGLAWLRQHLPDDSDCETVLALANGAPLAALGLARSGYLQLREDMLRDLKALIAGHGEPLTIAAAWNEAGADVALRSLQRVMVDLLRVKSCAEPPALFNPDRQDWLRRTAQRMDRLQLCGLLDTIGSALQALDGPLDRNMLLEDILIRVQTTAEAAV